MYGPVPSIAVPVPHEEFYKISFVIWIGVKIIWKMYTNQDAQSMDVSSTKAE